MDILKKFYQPLKIYSDTAVALQITSKQINKTNYIQGANLVLDENGWVVGRTSSSENNLEIKNLTNNNNIIFKEDGEIILNSTNNKNILVNSLSATTALNIQENSGIIATTAWVKDNLDNVKCSSYISNYFAPGGSPCEPAMIAPISSGDGCDFLTIPTPDTNTVSSTLIYNTYEDLVSGFTTDRYILSYSLHSNIVGTGLASVYLEVNNNSSWEVLSGSTVSTSSTGSTSFNASIQLIRLMHTTDQVRLRTAIPDGQSIVINVYAATITHYKI